MDTPFLYFGWLKSAYNRMEFAEEFGYYLASLKIADLYDLLYVPELGIFDFTKGGEYILSRNEKKRDGYVWDFVQLRISDDKNNIRKSLQDYAINEPEKIKVILNLVLQDIDYIRGSLDKISWLNHNDIIETHLKDFKKEIEVRYGFNVSDSLDKTEVVRINSSQTVSDSNTKKKVISGIKLEVYNSSTDIQRVRRIEEFVSKLYSEKYLANLKEMKLASMCFKGLDFKKQINWNSNQNSLGYLMFQLKNHPTKPHIIKSKDAGFLWKRTAECFTVKGEVIITDNLKSNTTPNLDEKNTIDSIINILKK